MFNRIAVALLAAGLFLAFPLQSFAQAPDTKPASVYPETVMVTGGKPDALIVSSTSDPAMAEAAGQLQKGLEAKYGFAFPSIADTEVCKTRLAPVSAEYCAKNLILVGNLYSNRAFFTLYAQFLCGSDSIYPGGDGYELRTVSNPWGTGRNVIIVGGSSAAGVKAGVQALLSALPEIKGQSATLPYLIDIKPGPAMKRQFEQEYGWYGKVGTADITKQYELYLFCRPAFRYYWTGEDRWAQLALGYLRALNANFKETYRISHYTMEGLYRAWDQIEEAPFLTEADRQTTIRNSC